MNANELADELEGAVLKLLANDCFLEAQAVEKVETTLRQQQEKINKYELRNIAQCDRIAILESQLRKAQEMNNQEKIKELEYLNNEHRGVIGILMDEREVLRAEIEALKAHPVKEQLTDEEIMDELVKVKHTWVATTSVWYEFEKEELKKAIRAILRKAQEQ